MKLLLIKSYLFVIVLLQRFLLAVSNTALKLYGPLPTLALRARLSIQEGKK
jgi:hypothetical protein